MSRELMNSGELYSLLQSYRHTPTQRAGVVEPYKAVKAYIERLLADEREKVREMCAVHIEQWINHWFKWRDAAPSLAQEIRQLDLTKDPAPSGREEGKR